MITKEYMDALKKRYINAKSDKEREELEAEMARLCEESPEEVAEIALAQAKETRADIEAINVRNKMNEVLPAISLAYIAKTYFGKTRQWLYQGVNGLSVNGKPAKFTPEELDKLNFALQDMGQKLMNTRIS